MPSPPAPLLNDVRSALDRASIGPDDLLIVGLSGGVDSQTLTHLLAALRGSDYGPKLLAVNVDHGLRPGSAQDATECRRVSERMGVPLEVVKVDVGAWDRGRGVEAAARDARFAALARAADMHGTSWVALGHSLDDQVETVLMRLARGTSLDGLTAMREISRRDVSITPDGRSPVAVNLLRPLLNRSRAEIELYAAEHGLVPIEDPSNADPRFRRNAVRHQLLPMLEQIAPGARHSIARSIDLLTADATYLETKSSHAFARDVKRLESCLVVSRQAFADLPQPIQGRVVARAAHELSPGIDLTSERVEAVRQAICTSEVSRRVEVGAGINAMIDYERVVLGPADLIEPTLRADSGLPLFRTASELRISGSMRVELNAGCVIDISLVSPRDGWVLRTRRSGDRVRFSNGASRKLQDWFVNQKVPAYLRDHVPLLVNAGLVRWIAGFSSPTFEDVDSGLMARLVKSAKEDQPDDERVAGNPSA